MFASLDHLIRGRATQIDDLTSLAYVAHKFIYGDLPWETSSRLIKDNLALDKAEFVAFRY